MQSRDPTYTPKLAAVIAAIIKPHGDRGNYCVGRSVYLTPIYPKTDNH